MRKSLLASSSPKNSRYRRSTVTTQLPERGSKLGNTFRVAIDLAMGKAFKSHIVSVT